MRRSLSLDRLLEVHHNEELLGERVATTEAETAPATWRFGVS
jgi:hypothetical protein